MNKKIFESHNLEDKKLPIIFHYDIIDSDSEFGENGNWHNNIEILYIDKGEGKILCSGVEYPAAPQNIFIINSNTIHAVGTKSSMAYYCLIIDSDFLEFNGLTTENLEYSPQISDTVAENLFLKLVKEINGTDFFSEASIKSATLALMVHLSKNHSVVADSRRAQKGKSEESVKLAMGYIKSHIEEPLCLEKLSFEAGMSKFYFVREFKKATGMTPFVFINTLRCQKAKKLLSKNKYSIHETAIKCGFENDSYFSKTFKKYVGVLPSEFAKAIK